MKIQARSIIASMLALSFASTSLPPATACAPDLAYAILVNGNHPDLPLKLFAAGNIGIVQPGWAKSYMVVAYRYLSNKPLSNSEQVSIINLWHERIKGGSHFTSMKLIDERDSYLALRAKAIGADAKKNSDISWSMDRFCYENNIGDSSMQQARKTLAVLLQKYKPLSPQIRDWVKAQDGLYGLPSPKDPKARKAQKIVVPVVLPSTADAILQECRNYQIGAANYYLNSYDSALAKFEQIAKSPNSPLKEAASYMVLRTRAAKARFDHQDENDAVAKILQNAANRADKISTREDILNLLRPINYLNLTSAEAVKMLSAAIASDKNQRFGGDVGDLTFLLDGNPLHPDETPAISTSSGDTTELMQASDLADWVLTVQNSMYSDYGYDDSPEAKAKNIARNERNARHALSMWRSSKSLPWLVSAVSTNTLRRADTKDLYDAAKNVPANSPAYFTCRFYLADALINSGKKQDARAVVAPLLGAKNLSPSSRNLFTMQMAAASQTTSDYLRYAVQNAPEILETNSDLVSPKFVKYENNSGYSTEISAFDSEVADDISRNAPLSTWISFSQSSTTPDRFKAIVLRSAWTRASLLERNDVALKISDAMAASNPLLRSAVAKFKNAPEGPARQFAAACLVLKNFGMTPYLQGGLERHGERVNEFDWYNGNFWVPFPLVKKAKTEEDSWSYYATLSFTGSASMGDAIKGYGDDGLASRLTAAEKKQAEADRALILKNNPSCYYGQTVLSWAQSHPADPDVPEMLYRIVRLPKWTTSSDVGSQFSKKAYLVLHNKYPNNKWTNKAVCYY